MVLPFLFVPFVIHFKAGLVLYWVTTNLWTVGQGLITRRLIPKPRPPPKRVVRTPPQGGAAPETAPEGEGGRREAAAPSRSRAAGAPRRVKRKKKRRRTAMSDELRSRRPGETVGEAKWPALRELERLIPGLDSARSVRGGAEGERGLLGVGTRRRGCSPRVDGRAVGAAEAEPRRRERVGPPRPRARSSEIARALGVAVPRRRRGGRRDDHGHVSRRRRGVLIGRHGQTIDAIQYLVTRSLYRGPGEERKPVVVDAAGYRDRRAATLDALAERSAEQASATGEPVELEPMTAVERKIVHLHLKDIAGVETAQRGRRAEPLRRRHPGRVSGLTPARAVARGASRDCRV